MAFLSLSQGPVFVAKGWLGPMGDIVIDLSPPALPLAFPLPITIRESSHVVTSVVRRLACLPDGNCD